MLHPQLPTRRFLTLFHQRREGELIKAWCPSQWVLCTCVYRCASPALASTSTNRLVHASDADQAEVLLTRWGPDDLGKLGSERLTVSPTRKYFLFATALHSIQIHVGLFP